MNVLGSNDNLIRLITMQKKINFTLLFDGQGFC